MRSHRLPTALALTLSASAACAPVDDDGSERAAAPITNASALAFPSEHGIAAIGLERAGVVTPQCTGAFLRNAWVLTHRRCVEGLPAGARLVVSNGVAPSAPSAAAPFAASVGWVGVAEKSALSSMPDLALVRLERAVATGRRAAFDASATFARMLQPASRPITSATDLRCFGFAFPGGQLRLGERLLRVASPGAAVVTVRAGFGETFDPSDDGGACLTLDGSLAAVLRARDTVNVDLVDLTRAPATQGEIQDALPASDAAARTGLWPMTFTDTVGQQALTARADGAGSHRVRADPRAPIWAQGFLNVEVARGPNTLDVQLMHRGTGRCLAATSTGYGLTPCAAARPIPAAQTFRVFFLADGSVQILSLAQQRCLTAASGDVVPSQCNTATGGQRWWQGLGRR